MDKKVCIIYTGGTIGMAPTEQGYAPAPGMLQQALDTAAELHSPEMPAWELLTLDPLLDSSDMTVNEWNRIGEVICREYPRFDGFVVLHGTDTMAYTAAALSFMLEGLDKPVVLTGSQIPLCRVRSDGWDNLAAALLIAGEGVAREISLYFGGQLLRGNRAAKLSADGLQAFDSPNYPPLATAGVDIRYDRAALARPAQSGPLRMTRLRHTPIGVLKVFPGIQFELFSSIVTEKLRGLVLETFGAGNIPGAGSGLLPLLEKARRHGAILTVCSQCTEGAVHLGTYASSSALKAAGAVSGLDMTTEAAVAKLYYLFSLDLTPEQIKHWMEQDLRGELTED